MKIINHDEILKRLEFVTKVNRHVMLIISMIQIMALIMFVRIAEDVDTLLMIFISFSFGVTTYFWYVRSNLMALKELLYDNRNPQV